MRKCIILDNKIEIDFQGEVPGVEIRTKMKSVKYQWDRVRRIWWAKTNDSTIAMAKEICGEQNVTHQESESHTVSGTEKSCSQEYALKIQIADIINADNEQIEQWVNTLKEYVDRVMSEDNPSYKDDAVRQSQIAAWKNCFKFISKNLDWLDSDKQKYEMIFEYSMPGTVHERPDVLLLTEEKVISLEFKRKSSPQVDDNKDDVAQAIRYKEWIENHHEVTKKRKMLVASYLVCTDEDAKPGNLRGITILTKDDFSAELARLLSDQKPCSFSAEWLSSPKTEMPDMLKAVGILYGEGKIPYLSDVNQECLKSTLKYIAQAKERKKKVLILIQGVPGSGKTAVGQSVVFEENKDGVANAVYLSGNGPLVEVLQYQIDQAGKTKHMGENAVQDMKAFKKEYFDGKNGFQNSKVPEKSILIFDEAQRAWNSDKTGRGFSEPEGLLRVGDKIFKEKGFAVIIGLYGNGQVIYTGEETGLPLWESALKKHSDWYLVASEDLLNQVNIPHKIRSSNMRLPASLRADFIDCSEWVEQAIGRSGSFEDAKKELEKLQNTSMRICVTRNFGRVRERAEEMDHREWKYGIIISNFAQQNIIDIALPGWEIGYGRKNELQQNKGQYGPWFTGGCKKLDQACSVFGCQGLELDCPIVVFGGEYIRQNGKWQSCVDENDRKKYDDVDTIVENNFRVLLTRAREEMILVIPDHKGMDETYQYFREMGMDELKCQTR